MVTEKMTAQGEDLNRYGFIVIRKANKVQIRKDIEKMYGVTVESVNTMICPGKAKTRYTRSGILTGRSSSYKKAVVTLAKGDEIDFYSNV